MLAGGRGTRLLPLTADLPKPMIPVAGRPFVDYLLEELARNGFEEVVLLLGYLAERVTDYYGDTKPHGLRLRYSITGVDDDTGSRVRAAAPLVDDVFMLMYCDNYWPLRLSRMWHAFSTRGLPAQITVYRNADGYSRDNVTVGLDGRVVHYDRSRSRRGLAGVDIGFAFLRAAVLDLLPRSGDVNFEDVVYPTLCERGELGAFVTEHRYYSAGSPERLPLTEGFLTGRGRTVILDRDGVLNEKPPPATYVTSPDQIRWLPGSLEALARLTAAGYGVVVVTNQAGVARGAMTEDELAAVHARMRDDARSHGGRIDAVYVCPHGWDDGCDCRKPRAGMLFRAQHDLALDLTRTWFVGDDPRDLEAGAEAGCRTRLLQPGSPLLDLVEREVLCDR